MDEEKYEIIKDAMERALGMMISWPVVFRTQLKGGAVLNLRTGTIEKQELWFVVLSYDPTNEEMIVDFPPKEELEESVLAAFSENDQAMLFWVFFSYDDVITELAKLFGLFTVNSSEEQ